MKVPVLVPKIFNFPFTYDSGSIKNLTEGDLVLVPFGKNEEIGVVWDQESNYPIKNLKLKKLNKKLIILKLTKA